MDPNLPQLLLMAANDGAEVWPMQWTAVRRGASDPLYVLELSTPTSPRLLVKRPVGEGVVEFIRAGCDPPNDAPSVTTLALRRSRSRSRRSRSRSGSRRRAEARGGTSSFLPGDWACPKCGDHQFARNLSCRSCGGPKPKGADDDPGGGGGAK